MKILTGARYYSSTMIKKIFITFIVLSFFSFFSCQAEPKINVLLKKTAHISIYTQSAGLYETDAHKLNAPKYIKGPLVYVDNIPYRGDIKLLPVGGRLYVVNMIDIEDYIKGILYNEISNFWPIEAIKAQAIVARTYALYSIKQNKLANRSYDLDATDRSQVYTGRNAERYRLSKAVDETKGLILECPDGKILPAFYHACCGGMTESANALWNVDLPCLKPVQCPFCKSSPHFHWAYNISQMDITNKLRTSLGMGFNEYIISIIPLGYTTSGRIKGLKLTTDMGNEYTISGKDFRAKLGAKNIRSTNFSVALKNGEFAFDGKGWGHGVGMCQWGAYEMAKKGYDFKEILGYYYPSSKIVKRWQ